MKKAGPPSLIHLFAPPIEKTFAILSLLPQNSQNSENIQGI
jgi:hypothetical protein